MAALRTAAIKSQPIHPGETQVRIAVNHRTEELDQLIIRNLPTLAAQNPKLQWISPLQSNNFRDAAERDLLQAIGRRDVIPRLATFWPRQPPRWHGLAHVELEIGSGAVFLYGMSDLDSAYGIEPEAKSHASTDLVYESLQRAKKWLGSDPDTDWSGELWAMAVRVAHVYFFREVAGIPAWMVEVCFVDDPVSPTSTDEWIVGRAEVRRVLGLPRVPDHAHPDVATAMMLAADPARFTGIDRS